jgi:Fe-S cluster assembly protein SufD
MESTSKELAIKSFQAVGFPTSKMEEWKYTSLKNLNDIAWNWQEFGIAVAQTNGLDIIHLNDLLNQSKAFQKVWQTKDPILDQNPFYELNTSLCQNPLVLWVKQGVKVENPINLTYQLKGFETNSAFQAKLIVFLESGAELSIIESASADTGKTFVSSYVQEIFLSEKSKLTYLKEQDLTDETTHIDQTFVFQEGESQAETFTLSLNGGVLRNNLHFYINGEQVVSNLNGLYVPAAHQLMDSHTIVDHRMPNSESNEFYKGILMDHSTGVFNGKIFVRKDAQKTNAFQSCRNVLASNKATMNTKPQLEIWADDVKCSHGTTTGQLNEESLFYMRSRGISLQSAKTLLLLAFAQEVIDKIPFEEVKNDLSEKIIGKIKASNDLTI